MQLVVDHIVNFHSRAARRLDHATLRIRPYARAAADLRRGFVAGVRAPGPQLPAVVRERRPCQTLLNSVVNELARPYPHPLVRWRTAQLSPAILRRSRSRL